MADALFERKEKEYFMPYEKIEDQIRALKKEKFVDKVSLRNNVITVKTNTLKNHLCNDIGKFEIKIPISGKVVPIARNLDNYHKSYDVKETINKGRDIFNVFHSVFSHSCADPKTFQTFCWGSSDNEMLTSLSKQDLYSAFILTYDLITSDFDNGHVKWDIFPKGQIKTFSIPSLLQHTKEIYEYEIRVLKGNIEKQNEELKPYRRRKERWRKFKKFFGIT